MRRAPLRCVLLLTIAGCARLPPPQSFAAPLPAVHEGSRLVVVGDLQRTAPLLEFWREQNDAERTAVIQAIADEHPDLVAITGDCVFNGGSDAQWAAFDALTEPWRVRGIPVVAAFGNHEYWSGREGAESHVFGRFPLDGGRHWFLLPFGPLRLVVLDSNAAALSHDAWTAQVAWLRSTLLSFDADPTVRGVVLLLHHPPYTSSTRTGDTLEVQRDLVPLFVSAHKTLAMLSGHVHSYERFTRDGRMYVVSGGGGGPRAPIDVSPERRHPDEVFHGPPLRDFNYTVYTLGVGGVRAEVHGLARGSHTWRLMDAFEMPWVEEAHVPST